MTKEELCELKEAQLQEQDAMLKGMAARSDGYQMELMYANEKIYKLMIHLVRIRHLTISMTDENWRKNERECAYELDQIFKV